MFEWLSNNSFLELLNSMYQSIQSQLLRQELLTQVLLNAFWKSIQCKIRSVHTKILDLHKWISTKNRVQKTYAVNHSLFTMPICNTCTISLSPSIEYKHSVDLLGVVSLKKCEAIFIT